MVDQSEMYGAALRLHESREERHVVEATYEQARSVLLDMVARALHATHGSVLGEADIVDLVDDRVIMYVTGSLAEIQAHLMGGGNQS